MALLQNINNFSGPTAGPTSPASRRAVDYFMRYWPEGNIDCVVRETHSKKQAQNVFTDPNCRKHNHLDFPAKAIAFPPSELPTKLPARPPSLHSNPSCNRHVAVSRNCMANLRMARRAC